MLTAFALALSDLRLPALRGALLRAVGLALLLFMALLGAMGWGLAQLSLSGIGWLDTALDLLGGAAALVAALFLFGPATLSILPLFLDAAAAAVESRHYPHLPPARPAPLAQQLSAGLRLAGLAVALNLAALPVVLLLPVVGPVAWVLVNGRLLGREYFELAALRRLDLAQARAARRRAGLLPWAAGCLLAGLGLVPLGNLVAPLLGAAAFVHVFHRSNGLAARDGGV